MIVQSLDHVNIRVKDPAATIAFFNVVLGMPSLPERRKRSAARRLWNFLRSRSNSSGRGSLQDAAEFRAFHMARRATGGGVP